MTVWRYIPGTTPWRRRRDVRLCEETLERMQEIVDGEIPPQEAGPTLRRHLDACGRCQREAEAIERLKAAICRVGEQADDELVARLEQMARRLCSGEAQPEDR